MFFKEGYSLWRGFSGYCFAEEANFAGVGIHFNSLESLLTKLVLEFNAAVNHFFDNRLFRGEIAGNSQRCQLSLTCSPFL